MQSALGLKLRDQLRRYVDGEISLSEFDEWFVPATLDVERWDDPAAEELTWEIFLRIAEYSHGDWTEAELKQMLGSFAGLPVAAVSAS